MLNLYLRIGQTALVLALLLNAAVLAAQEKALGKYTLYLDADFTTTKAAGVAIKQGIETALSEHNFQVNGYQLELITKDHRGNSRRSKKHLDQFVADKQALLMFGGLHSPPLLANKSKINNQRILTLVPWAAAGPITRTTGTENWIFRLSIDDSNAGGFISQQAISQGFKKPYLLLEDTGWGRSNKRTMSKALAKLKVKPSGFSWFNWGIKDNQARILMRKVIDSGADVIFFVGNAPEGKVLINALLSLSSDIAVRSHWGITGGDFEQVIDAKKREHLHLQFIQTKFSFVSSPPTSQSNSLLAKAISRYPELKSATDIKAPTGFIHAYDLTKILVSAINQVTLTGNRDKDKLAIKNALENLQQSVAGLIKTYEKPFSNEGTKDSHEALGVNDYAMGSYGQHNEIKLWPLGQVK